MFCQEYWAERQLETHIARFHNIYGPNGTWFGGREKAPAAMCRKVLEAQDSGDMRIEIWGDGEQTRSFMYIDDCTRGIAAIMDSGITFPINLGSAEMVSINQLVDIIEGIAGITLNRRYKLDAPKGVRGRSSDNTLFHDTFGWEPSISLREGLESLEQKRPDAASEAAGLLVEIVQRVLQGAQAVTMFSHVVLPPIRRGITWSNVK